MEMSRREAVALAARLGTQIGELKAAVKALEAQMEAVLAALQGAGIEVEFADHS